CCHLLHERERLAGAVAGRRLSGDRRRRIEIVSTDALRTELALHVDESRERHHLPRWVAHLELFDVVRRYPKRRLGLDAHLIRPTEEREVVHVSRAEIRLQATEDAR